MQSQIDAWLDMARGLERPLNVWLHPQTAPDAHLLNKVIMSCTCFKCLLKAFCGHHSCICPPSTFSNMLKTAAALQADAKKEVLRALAAIEQHLRSHTFLVRLSHACNYLRCLRSGPTPPLELPDPFSHCSPADTHQEQQRLH